MKYKIGDKVKIIRKFEPIINEDYRCIWNFFMNKYINTYGIIIGYDKYTYNIEFSDALNFHFHESSFDKKRKEKIKRLLDNEKSSD